MGEAPDQMILVETAEDVERLDVADPAKVAYLTQTTLSVDDANVVIAALRQEVPPDRQSAQGRHLLRHPEPPGGGARAGRAGRPGARARQPEQLEQPATGGDRQRRSASRPTSSTASPRSSDEWFRRRRDGADHRRGQRTRGGRAGVHRLPPEQFRRDAFARRRSARRTSTSPCRSRSGSCCRRERRDRVRGANIEGT